jgi:putative ABC transport system ATP-binding protein
MPPSGEAERTTSRSPPLAISGLVVDRRESPAVTRRVLDGVSVDVEPGSVVAVTGPSGAGKTTLLHAAAGLLQPQAGRVCWGDLDVTALSETKRDRWRRDSVGLIFQDFQLFAELSVLENILLPIRFDHWRTQQPMIERAALLAARVGLAERSLRAGALSHGEQQRVAIARALMRRPRLILADEPTASLDADNGARIIEVLIECAREEHASVLLASHDSHLLAHANRVYRLTAGGLQVSRGEAP